MEKYPPPVQALNHQLQRISDVSKTHNEEILCKYCRGQTSQDCRPESWDTNHKSLASMGIDCTSSSGENQIFSEAQDRRGEIGDPANIPCLWGGGGTCA